VQKTTHLSLTLVITIALTTVIAPARADLAGDILSATGITGGLVVHVGCGEGKLTAALRASDSYLVHGLDTDAANVAVARKHIRAAGVYGKISVDRFAGKALPYIENSVNLVVAEDLGDVPMAEVLRVLCPNGVAYIQSGGKWTKTVKPRPKEIDDWTHYMHSASGNAVAQDSVVAPPKRLQWLGSPAWSRHHDHMSSFSAVVSAGGRVFYIIDEGSRVSILLPPKWKLVARDAFNGTILWKRPLDNWFNHLQGLKSGPAVLPRRLVAVGNRVYVTLGLDGPLVAIDAASGKTVRTYKATAPAEEVIASEGTLFVVSAKEAPVGNAPKLWEIYERDIRALDAETGKVRWTISTPVMPMTLAADAKGVYFHDGEKVVGLNRETGKRLWASKPVPRTSKFSSFYGATLVVYEGVVLFSGGETAGKQTGSWYTSGTDTLTAVSAKTGEQLWKGYHPPSGYRSPEDVLVAGGLVWTGETTSGKVIGEFTGRDPRTGEVKSTFNPDVETYWFHHRCYRGKATEKYLLMSRGGTEFIDHKAKHWITNHWIRGACLYGVMPANGLLYAPPHPCACYPEAKQNGFSVVAPAATSKIDVAPGPRLEKGPAFARNPKSAIRNPQSQWPTYRGDAVRSGRTKGTVSAKLKQAWTTKLGGKLSSVVAAEGKLFVASVEDHTVHALDAKNGKKAWSFTAGGRVDSPPTIWQGRAIFGSADGSVYCLQASDGALIWRFRAAPDDRRLVSFEQVESVWPVHGSVLVQDGAVFCVAGRSMFLDGGLRMIKLDAATGKLLRETVLGDTDPQSDGGLQAQVKGLDMPVALPDILSGDGKYVYMRSQRFDAKGVRQDVSQRSIKEQIGEGMHLFSPTGFMDDAYWHRSYWVYGRTFSGGYSGYSQAGKSAPAGKIMAFDDTTVYGFGRKAKYFRWTTPIEHHLFADVKGELRRGGQAAAGGTTGGPWVTVDNTDSLDPTDKPLAVEAWINATSPNGVVLARGGPSLGYALILQGGKPLFVVRTGGKVSKVAADAKVVGKWTHLVGVLTADKKLKLYVDGNLAATAPATGLLSGPPAQPMEIGADAGGSVGEYPSPMPFAGLIDEVRVLHGRLTEAEIASHAAVGGKVTAKDAKLVLCISFDDGKAGDASGAKNHGKVGGAKFAEGKFGKAMKLGPAKSASAKRRTKRPAAAGFLHRWAHDVPMIVRAMVLADAILFIAGPPDLLDEEQAKTRTPTPEIQARIAAQEASLLGKKGSIMWAVSTKDGAKLAEYTLESMPVFDSLIAANARLYWTTTDGRVMCMEAEKE